MRAGSSWRGRRSRRSCGWRTAWRDGNAYGPRQWVATEGASDGAGYRASNFNGTSNQVNTTQLKVLQNRQGDGPQAYPIRPHDMDVTEADPEPLRVLGVWMLEALWWALFTTRISPGLPVISALVIGVYVIEAAFTGPLLLLFGRQRGRVPSLRQTLIHSITAPAIRLGMYSAIVLLAMRFFPTAGRPVHLASTQGIQRQLLFSAGVAFALSPVARWWSLKALAGRWMDGIRGVG